MAERRMFSKTIIDSDAFLDMSASAQALYFHLAMRADDDGFINNPKKIQRIVGSADDDLKILVAKRFVLSFASGVIVIKHWKLHNYIRKDRYTETLYQGEKSLLYIKKNGAYTDHDGQGKYLRLSSGQPTVNQRLTQDRIGKVRLGKGSRRRDDSDSDDGQDDISSAAKRCGLPWHESNQTKAEKLEAEYSKEWLIQAIDRVSLRDRQNWGLVEGILRSWKHQGFIDEDYKKHTSTTSEEQPSWVTRDD